MEFRSIIDIQFKGFDRSVFEKSKEWLDDSEIKRLTNAPETDQESREQWFQSLTNRSDYYIISAWRGDNPIGVVGLKYITKSDAEAFIYIGEKKYWGKAVGIEMLKYIIEYGRTLEISSIYAKLLKENIRSYKLASRFGFKIEKDLDEKSILMRYYY
jgi:RimJ/RimL family protein N-acetyltransferase